MKKLVKPLSFVLAAMMCVCLSGCGNESKESTPANNNSSTNNVSTPGNTSKDESSASGTPETNITLEPVVITVSEITLDPEAGYGYHHSSNYGNAFGLIYSYGSTNGREVTNATIMIVPNEMKNLDDILATEYCKEIDKSELAEADVGGVTGWISTKEAAQALTEALSGDDADSYDELYVRLKTSELAAKGVSADEALVQAMNALARVGLGDVG